MQAMVLNSQASELIWTELPDRLPDAHEIRISISACGVCRTDLHVLDGELPDIKYPIIPGHEIVGHIDMLGAAVKDFHAGQRVGVPWLGHTCGVCMFCKSQQENLCDHPSFTGYTRDGGFATSVIADARFVFALPEGRSDVATAPLLCAGLIGWRSLEMVGDGQRLGIYGFGAAGHIVAQIAKFQKRSVFAFTRPGDSAGQDFAKSVGVDWAGDSDQTPPEMLDGAIIYAPVGDLVPLALRAVRKGGRVVCAGIHMSDIPRFPYRILWEERSLRSVANLTRADGLKFFSVLPAMDITTHTRTYALRDANQALADLRNGEFSGAAVLVPD